MPLRPSLAGSVLITGGTSGLGFALAKMLAAGQGGSATAAAPEREVIVTGRDPEAAAAAAGVRGIALELGSLEQVRKFAARADLAQIGALVCNAGIQSLGPAQFSEDGYELTFAVNHLAHFLLATLLSERMAPGSRIIVVSSDTHDPRRHTGMPAPAFTSATQLAREPDADGRTRYTTSKLANVLFAYEAQRRLTSRGIDVFAFDPGLMPGTGLARDYPPLQRILWRRMLPALTVLPLNIHSTRASAAALARLLVAPGPGGRYFSSGRETRSSAQSYDEALAAQLWEQSEQLTRPADRGSGR